MSDVASLSVALHLNSAAFKSQITDAYQSAGQASKKFNQQARTQASELSAAITRTVDAAKKKLACLERMPVSYPASPEVPVN